MIPIKLKIKGFGPYQNEEINFSKIKKPISLLAPYGSGKTALIESILFCLFGRGAWYAGGAYDFLTQNGTGEGEIEFEFSHNGGKYKAKRIVKYLNEKNKSQKAILYLDGEAIAGPKIQDFEKRVGLILGDFETFIATQFLSQNRRGDLIGQPGEPDLIARRRAVFNELIGAADLDKIEQKIMEELKANIILRDLLKAQLLNSEEIKEEINNLNNDIKIKKEILKDQSEKLDILKEDLHKKLKELQKIEGDDISLKNDIEEYQRIIREKESLQNQYLSLKKEIEELKIKASKIEELKNQSILYDNLMAKRGFYQEKDKKFKIHKEWEDLKNKIENNLLSIQSKIKILSESGMPSPETFALANQYQEIINQGINLKKENEEIQIRNKERQDKRNLFQNKIISLESEIENLKSRLEKKPKTPGGEICNQCPLIYEYNEIPEFLKIKETDLKKAQIQLSEIPPDDPIHDLSELRIKAEKAKIAKNEIEKTQKNKEILLSLEREYKENNEKYINHLSKEPEKANDPSESLIKIQKEIDNFSGVKEKLNIAYEAKDKIFIKEPEFEKINLNLKNIIIKEAEIKIKADKSNEILQNREKEKLEIAQKIDEFTHQIQNIESIIKNYEKEIIQKETQIIELEKDLKENENKNQQIISLNRKIEIQSNLRRCFGARGVRQILIDNAAPELEEIANDLFQKAAPGKYRLRIQTQSILNDGSFAEDFSIQIADERGERDATRFSGGQLQLIIILFRIAVSLWIGKLRGVKPDCLILDEAFDRLGKEGTEDLIRLIDSLADQIEIIIIITHDPLIAEKFPGMIKIQKTFSGAKIISREEN